MSGVNLTDVGVLDKSMAIISACEARPMTAADIADEFGFSIPTVHRLARALVAHGLLGREVNGSFSLGHRFLTSGLAQVARQPLRDLVATTGEACQLWVPRGVHRLCLVSESAPKELRVELHEGTLLPLADGGTAARVINGETSAEGWIQTVSERTPGLTSISAPIALDGELLGALCIVAPVARVATSMSEMFGTRLLVTASEVERAIAGNRSLRG